MKLTLLWCCACSVPQVLDVQRKLWAPQVAHGAPADAELPPSEFEGAALFDLAPATEAESSLMVLSLPCAVLLTFDPMIAEEVNSLADEGDSRLVYATLVALGHALRHSAHAPPRCSLPLLLAAADAAVRRGWHATAERLLPQLADALAAVAAGDALAASGSGSPHQLVFAALASGEPAMLHKSAKMQKSNILQATRQV